MRILSLLGILLLSACTHLANPIYSTDDGAINGYDPVAYIEENKAIKGVASHVTDYQGHRWYFASATNKARFEQSPQQYLPQYGGYCAYGMSKGYVVSTDPEAFTVHEGKLYLNYSLSVRKTWLKDIPNHIEKADKQWLKKIESGDEIKE